MVMIAVVPLFLAALIQGQCLGCPYASGYDYSALYGQQYAPSYYPAAPAPYPAPAPYLPAPRPICPTLNHTAATAASLPRRHPS
ncbi:unnamed protein product [Plutella xylostella]|uniref:(diamondback moth) hypothetical protein n=1 Tax=Plutella xylostella TaxID=51655 RepID=A0A8S4DBA0_PLUXY|nr:unnamed protein product [Plutella xylostella]